MWGYGVQYDTQAFSHNTGSVSPTVLLPSIYSSHSPTSLRNNCSNRIIGLFYSLMSKLHPLLNHANVRLYIKQTSKFILPSVSYSHTNYALKSSLHNTTQSATVSSNPPDVGPTNNFKIHQNSELSFLSKPLHTATL